jgi:L-alanine-DL-glutamate epimerase-like enolase superfamily enzyme
LTTERELLLADGLNEAAGMTITSVDPVLLSATYEPDDIETWSGGTVPGFTAALARIRTSDGLEGVGETYVGNFAPRVAAALIHYYGSLLQGADPSEIIPLISRCRSQTLYWGRNGVAIASLSAVEAALWDLCGKALGVPAVDLLGGAVHDRIAVYASGGMDGVADDLAAEIQRHVDKGYRAVKIRVGVNAEADSAKVAVARSALGPALGLAVDAVQGSNPRPWRADEAIEAGQRMGDYDLLWYEEPCAATDIDGYRRCRAALDIPIAAGESATTLDEILRLVDADAVDILQPDASFIGGMQPTLEVGAAAARRGLEVAMHAWGSGASVLANVHAAFAMESCHWIETPVNSNPLVQELMIEPPRVVDGQISAPTAPGLGVSLSPELEEQFPFAEHAHYHFAERR